MKLLVSACLLGMHCRYDGGGKLCPEILALGEKHQLLPLCPELMGGLPIPRPPAERQGERIVDRLGRDVTGEFQQGAQQVLRLARLWGAEAAVLKERSPSCGKDEIYDDSFQGRLVPGQGILARYLREAGLPVYGETEIGRLL